MPDPNIIPAITPPGEGTPWSVVGDQVTCKVAGEQTGGRYAVVEEASPPGVGPPLHRHRATDEVFYVIEGEYEVTCAGETFRAGQGTVFSVPRDTAHSLRNVSTSASRLLVTIVPAGFERFFAAIDGVTDPARLTEIAKDYDIELLPAEG